MKTLALLAALSLPFSCAHAPKPGEACKDAGAVCNGPGQALTCQDGTYQPTGCRGPEGCKVNAERQVFCDQSLGALEGEACLPGYQGEIQCSTTDPAGFLTCNAGVWTKAVCEGAKRCAKSGGNIVCAVPAPTQ